MPAAENQEIFDKKVRDKANLENSLRKTIADLDQRFQEKLKEKYPALGLKAILPQDPSSEVTTCIFYPTLETTEKFGNTLLKTPAITGLKSALMIASGKRDQGDLEQGHAKCKGSPTWNGKDIWLRKDFRLTSIPENLTLHIHHDEDAEIYLNGSLIHRAKSHTTDYIKIDALARRVFPANWKKYFSRSLQTDRWRTVH